MNKFIRGLDNREKLDRVLKAIGYRAINDNLYTIDKSISNSSGHYLYLMDDNMFCLNNHEGSRLIYMPLYFAELRFFVSEDFMTIELLCVAHKIKFLQQLFKSNSKAINEKILKELKDDLEDEE